MKLTQYIFKNAKSKVTSFFLPLRPEDILRGESVLLRSIGGEIAPFLSTDDGKNTLDSELSIRGVFLGVQGGVMCLLSAVTTSSYISQPTNVSI